MIDVFTLVTSTWIVLQPYIPILASKAVEEVGKTAVVEIWAAIKNKFDMKDAAKEALAELVKHPQDADVQGAFRLQLRKLLEEDNAFASELVKLLEKTGSDFKGQIIGDGAIAQGIGAKAVGRGGILVEGDMLGSDIATGEKNLINSNKTEKKT